MLQRVGRWSLCALSLLAASTQAYAGTPVYAHSAATGGSGTSGSPYTGWESALAADTEIIFHKGYYQSPVTAITIPSGSVLTGVDGAILQWPSNRTSVNAMFNMPAGNANVVIQGLQFEAGVTVPDAGVASQGGGAYIMLGTDGSASQVSNVTIRDCHFGVARYSTSGGLSAFHILVLSGFENLVVRDNFFDTSYVNVLFMPGWEDEQYAYERFTFQDNLVDYSRSRSFFGAVLHLGSESPADVPATLRQVTIAGNTLHNTNGNFDILLAAEDLLVEGNNVYSDNADNFSFFIPPTGETARNVVYSGNTCRAEASADPNKVAEGTCGLNVVYATNVAIVGNSFYGAGDGAQVITGGSSHVLVANNVVDKGRTETESGDSCYFVAAVAYGSFTGNTCLNTGGRAFFVDSNSANENHDLSFTDNQLFTSVGSSIAEYFLYFDIASADVTVRDNRVWGQDVDIAFLGGTTPTRLNRVGNQEAIQETGWRIGSDQVSDITGTGLQVSSGVLGINSTVATLTGTQTLTNKDLTAGTNTFPSSLATLTGTQALTNKDLTATSNLFPQTGVISFTTLNVTGTIYCGPSTALCNATESNASLGLPRFVVSDLRCRASAAPGSGKSWVLTFRSGGSDTSLTCTIADSATSCSDTTHAPTTTDGAEASLKIERVNSPATGVNVTCVAGVGP